MAYLFLYLCIHFNCIFYIYIDSANTSTPPLDQPYLILLCKNFGIGLFPTVYHFGGHPMQWHWLGCSLICSPVHCLSTIVLMQSKRLAIIFVFNLELYFNIFVSPRTQIPSWVLILAAIGLFVYQTLDACDGKQARRTGSSSSLGELFDHGCDAVSTSMYHNHTSLFCYHDYNWFFFSFFIIVFVSLSVCLSVQLGFLTTWMVVLCAGATSLFYTAHWQTYVSGTLKFGKFDVTEAQFTIITIHLISAFFGTNFWSTIVCPIYNNI